MSIFSYTDPDGDRIEAFLLTRADRAGHISVYQTTSDSSEASVHLPPAEVTRLRKALEPYDPEAQAAKGTLPPADEVEVGREYRLLPGARHAEFPISFPSRGVTRVRVVEGADEDGDVRIQALDGEPAHNYARVMPRYLAPLEPAPDRAALAMARREGYAEGAADLGLDIIKARQEGYEQGRQNAYAEIGERESRARRVGYEQGHKAGAEAALEGVSDQLERRRVAAVETATAQLASIAMFTGTKPAPGDVLALAALILGEFAELAQASIAANR